ncbi:MAG: hypothetical protein II956_02295 [Bacteroidales bacterium]|nr:hypothetical protein [Bacteroidales bacterium]
MKLHKKLLIAASTENELSGAEKLSQNTDIDIFITGTGTFLPIYTLTKLFSENKYDLAIFFGICGVYNQNEELLKLYSVEKTTFSDCGIEDENQNFVPLTETSFFNKNAFKMSDGYFFNSSAKKFGIETAACNTVSRCISEKNYVEKMLKKFPAEIETMESAAFALVCLNEKQKFLEIRCSSNYVAPKNEKKWQVLPAIKKLGKTIDYFVSSKITDSDSEILA